MLRLCTQMVIYNDDDDNTNNKRIGAVVVPVDLIITKIEIIIATNRKTIFRIKILMVYDGNEIKGHFDFHNHVIHILTHVPTLCSLLFPLFFKSDEIIAYIDTGLE